MSCGILLGRREERRMTITTTYRIFFSWNESAERYKFEHESPQYKKVSEDSVGTTYEYKTEYIVNFKEKDREI